MINLIDIKNDKFLSSLSTKELEVLSKEIREFIIDKVSRKGGHLSSNLGIVELTVALHKHYSDNIAYIFDVGHQAYTHKILTGRAKDFDTLRDLDGLSGIVSREEDPIADIWGVGHSSTSIAALSGFAYLGKRAVAIIGDGAMTGGEAYEGLEFLSTIKNKALILLNENYMSISPNVGAMTIINNKKAYFELLGFNYIGPIDGHNFDEIEKALSLADKYDTPVVVHALTKKGKGYKFAEEDKVGRWHATAPFDIATGNPLQSTPGYIAYDQAVANYLEEFYAKTRNLIVINPAMTQSCGFQNLKDNLGSNYIDTGITEQLAASLAASLSINNKNVFLALYSSFGQRAFDQLMEDIALQNLHVVIGIDKCGIVSDTGKTHQGIYDIGYLNAIPNLTILSPSTYKEIFSSLDYAFNKCSGPVVIRYPQTKVKIEDVHILSSDMNLSWDKIHNLKSPKAYLIAHSSSIEYLFDTTKELNVELVYARCLRPLDTNLLLEISKSNLPIYVYEEAPYNNSLASMILSFYNERGINKHIESIGLPFDYIGVGPLEDLRKKYKIDKVSVFNRLKKDLCD